jgi:hypothetical protein
VGGRDREERGVMDMERIFKRRGKVEGGSKIKHTHTQRERERERK